MFLHIRGDVLVRFLPHVCGDVSYVVDVPRLRSASDFLLKRVNTQPKQKVEYRTF